MNSLPTVVAAGPWDDPQFAAVRQAVDPAHRWPVAPTLADVAQRVESAATPPELVLLAQPRPGLDEQCHVDRLHRLAPLIRIVVVAGSWCEGELRTGRPLVGVVRLYWHQLPAWWRAAEDAIVHGARPPWSDPLDDVRAGHPAADALGQPQRLAGTVLIDTRDFAVFESIAAALAPIAGRQCTWRPRQRTPTGRSEPAGDDVVAGIWDGGQLDEHELPSLTEFAQALAARPAPLLVLVDFPRLEHLELARSAGASLLMGKPYDAGLLCREVIRMATKSPLSGLL